MKRQLLKHLRSLCLLLVACLLFFLLQGQFRYVFLGIGDGRIFLWDTDFFKSCVFQPGCFSVWLDGFFVQFFHLPLAGTAIASILMTVTTAFTFGICRRIRGGFSMWMFPLTLLPTAFLCLDVLTDSYSFQAVTDYFLVTGIILVCTCRREKEGTVRSLWPGLAAAAILILATGPVLRPLTIPGSHRFIYVAWISLAVCCAASFAFGKTIGEERVTLLAGVLLLVLSSVAVSAPFFYFLEKCRQPRQEQVFQLSYYARNSQWSYITAVSRRMDMNNYMLLNYANLALGCQGSLLEHWTDYRQDDVQALCVKSDLTVGCMALLSMIYYEMGNIAAAQDMAFEANQCQSSPSLLQTLVRTNLIFGSYSVAEKYIAKLEKTLFYRDWARGMRKFLSDDGVLSDTVLSSKRKGLPDTDAFIVRDRIIDDLFPLLEADPSNVMARDYAIVYLHLSRDATSLLAFVDRFYGTKVLPTLSPAMQMGLLSATGGDEQYCRDHGVSDGIIAVYVEQKKKEER